MRGKGRYSYKDKVKILIKLIKEDNFPDGYEQYPGAQLTSEEYLKLYESKKKIDGLSKELLYPLLSEEEKLKHIDDLEIMYGIENILFSGTIQSPELKREIIRILIRREKINEENYSRYISVVKNDEKSCYMILSSVLEENPEKRSAFFRNLKNVSEEDKFDLLKRLMLGYGKSEDVTDIMIEIESIQNSIYKLVLITILISRDYFAANKMRAELRFKRLVEILSPMELRLLLNHLIENGQLNENFSLETALACFPASEIVNCFKYFGIKININELIKNVTYEQWLEIYKYLDKLPDGNRYIDAQFIFKGRNKCDLQTFNKMVSKYILYNDGKEVREKIRIVYSLYGGKRIFDGIELLIDHLGENIDIDLQVMTADMNIRIDMNKYPKTINYIAKKLNITNKENFKKFLDRFGNFAVPYLFSGNIIELLNMDSEQFDKVMSLISEEKTSLDIGTVNTVVNALLQRKFRIEHEDDYNIFSKFERLLINKNEYTIEEVNFLLKKIGNVVDIYSVINKEKIDINKLFENDKEEIELLHKLTDAYIAKKREMYVIKNLKSAMDELNIDRYYSKSYIKKYFFLLNDERYLMDFFSRMKYSSVLTEEEKNFLGDKTKINQLIEFKKNSSNIKPTAEIIENLKMLENIMNKLYEERLLELKTEPIDAKYDYYIKEITENELLNILSNLNYKRLEKCVLNNKESYESLNGLLKKYKIAGWGNTFEKLGVSADVNVDSMIVASLINSFDKISEMYHRLPKNSQTLTALLDCANAYAGGSKKYICLTNKENYNLILTNPGPNSSSAPKYVRLNQIPECVKGMYLRDSVTVPSGEMTLEVKNGKKIQVSIADIYDPIALTYGERTGACLRIEGAFNDLFEYCLKDKNGFHIRFCDPETGEFISRVSGIRNGNTVFLNELRDSVSDKYTSEELVEILKRVAKLLVEATKNDPCPIENVVVSNDYAMSKEKNEDLHIKDSQQAFRGLNFNISISGHVLYTANEEDHLKLMPYKFGDEYASEYKPYNTKVCVANKETAVEVINKVHFINEMLNGKTIDEIAALEIHDVEKCIYGHGWVVYVDSKNVIHELIIDKFKGDQDLRKLIDESKKKYFGGIKHETNRKNN